MLLCHILVALQVMKRMIKYNILITSVGRRVSLVRLFKKAIKDLNINGMTVETILPDYIFRFRDSGQFNRD